MSSYLDYGNAKDDNCLKSMFGRDSDSSDDEAAIDVTVEANIPHEMKEITKFPSNICKTDITIETSRVRGIAHQLWPASFLLCKYLEDNYSTYFSSPSSTSVVELGAGVGLGGLLCGMFGCRSVMVTDLPEAMELIDRNIHLNGHLFPHPDNIRSAVLRWGEMEDCVSCMTALGAGGGESGHEGDALGGCSVPGHQEQTSLLVIAADCVYWEHLYAPLFETLLYFTSRGATVVLSHTKRWKREKKFFSMCARRMAVEVVYEAVQLLPEEEEEEAPFSPPPEVAERVTAGMETSGLESSSQGQRRVRRQVSRVYVLRGGRDKGAKSS